MNSGIFLFGLMVALYERPKTCCWITIQGLFTLLVPFSTGSHLSLRMWFGGQPNRPLEGRRAADQVFTTPGLKTASMRTSSVSDSENAKTHRSDITVKHSRKHVCTDSRIIAFIFFLFVTVRMFGFRKITFYFLKKLIFLFRKDTLN